EKSDGEEGPREESGTSQESRRQESPGEKSSSEESGTGQESRRQESACQEGGPGEKSSPGKEGRCQESACPQACPSSANHAEPAGGLAFPDRGQALIDAFTPAQAAGVLAARHDASCPGFFF
ncbi:MAG: hypothetical protein KA826_08590, partial [Ottowia sp.]|nr:hypothetical protein [Ottowia sp.]MBP9671628.1 hypothetical protein [Ottowia sp.]